MPGVLRGPGERIGEVVDVGVGVMSEVDDPDVHATGVAVLHNPVDTGNHLGDIDGAVGGADLDVDDPAAGGAPHSVLVLVAMMPAMLVP